MKHGCKTMYGDRQGIRFNNVIIIDDVTVNTEHCCASTAGYVSGCMTPLTHSHYFFFIFYYASLNVGIVFVLRYLLRLATSRRLSRGASLPRYAEEHQGRHFDGMNCVIVLHSTVCLAGPTPQSHLCVPCPNDHLAW